VVLLQSAKFALFSWEKKHIEKKNACTE